MLRNNQIILVVYKLFMNDLLIVTSTCHLGFNFIHLPGTCSNSTYSNSKVIRRFLMYY